MAAKSAPSPALQVASLELAHSFTLDITQEVRHPSEDAAHFCVCAHQKYLSVHEAQVVNFFASSFVAVNAAAEAAAAFAARVAGSGAGNTMFHTMRPSVYKPQIHSAKIIRYSIYFMTVDTVLEDSSLELLVSSADLTPSALIFSLTVSVMKDIGFAGHYRSLVRFVVDTEMLIERVGVSVVDLLRDTEIV